MPSIYANEIIRIIEEAVGEHLSVEQKLKCEEIVYNVYPGAAKRFISRWAQSVSGKDIRHVNFDYVYAPIINGIIVGAMKRTGDQIYKFDTAQKRMTYAMMHSYLGNDFSQRELETIVWLMTYATPKEIETAINVAQHHGVSNGSYVRAIIVGNRRRAAAQIAAKDQRFKKITNDPPGILTGVPNVKSLQDAWTKRLKDAANRATEEDVERDATQKISF